MMMALKFNNMTTIIPSSTISTSSVMVVVRKEVGSIKLKFYESIRSGYKIVEDYTKPLRTTAAASSTSRRRGHPQQQQLQHQTKKKKK